MSINHSMDNIIYFDNDDFQLYDIQKLNKKYDNKIIIVKFSKPNCIYCNICKTEYSKLSNKLSEDNLNDKYLVAEIDC